MLTTFTVTSLLDSHVNGKITVREAILQAFNNPGPDTIDFSTNSGDGLNGETILLTQGELAINDTANVTIDASMLSNGITIDGNDPSSTLGDGTRIFHITDPSFGSSPPLVTMIGLTLTGGDSDYFGGAILSEEGRLVLEDCTIDSNSAFAGGGIAVSASNSTSGALNYLTLQNTSVQNNTAYTLFGGGGAGGGVWVQASGNFGADVSILQSSSITGNKAHVVGGGLYLQTSGPSQIDISDTLISGNTSDGEAGGGLRIFSTGASVTIERTTISENTTVKGGGGMSIETTNGMIEINESKLALNTTTGPQSLGEPLGAGAYIKSTNSSVTISGSEISGNEALGIEGNIGGITILAANNSNILVDHVQITDNHADDDVGGLFIGNNGSVVTVQYSTISGNTANDNNVSLYDAAGGAWISTSNSGYTTVKYSTISDNKISITPSLNDSGKRAGGLFITNAADTTTTILNSTISGNEAQGSGGGIKIGVGGVGSQIEHGGVVLIRHSTITNNRANSNDDTSGDGGGIHVGNSDTTVTLDHTIVAGNWNGPGTTTRDDIAGSVTATWSLIGDNTGATITNNGGNQIGTSGSPINPNLAPLAFNGGVTQTHAPKIGSPVIDAGTTSVTGLPDFDQRGSGFNRKVGTSVDIGAHEVNLPKVVDVVIDGSGWARDGYSFAELVPQGKQLAPIFTAGVDRIKIHFSEDVGSLTGDEFLLYGTVVTELNEHLGEAPAVEVDDVDYDPDSHIATLIFNDPLPADRYRIDVISALVEGSAGRLDGKWDNVPNDTLYDWTDDFADLPPGHVLVSGNGNGGTDFQFMFALNPGDYNQNGLIDGADYVMWENGPADGDGDGEAIGDDDDYDLWNTRWQEYLWFRTWQGDINGDGAVDMKDWAEWRKHVGLTGAGLLWDLNGNGIVDTADRTLWANYADDISAWHLPKFGAFSGTALIDSASAPQVVNVVISRWNSTYETYAFDAHDGSGEQLRTVPVGRADTISITFSEDVNVVAENLRFVGLSTGVMPTMGVFHYDVNTMTASWNFWDLAENNPWMADHFLISLSDAVTDLQGYRLDGEWVNPNSISTTNSLVSEFPSGNGHAGGNFNFVITLLPGDVDRNNIVDEDDLYIVHNTNWQTYGTWDEGDMTGDGDVGWPDDEVVWDHMDLDLTTVHILADLDGDFDVDDDDVETLGGNFGMSSPTWADGDLNGDGYINNTDLDLMFAQYGLEVGVVS